MAKTKLRCVVCGKKLGKKHGKSTCLLIDAFGGPGGGAFPGAYTEENPFRSIEDQKIQIAVHIHNVQAPIIERQQMFLENLRKRGLR